MDKKNRVTLAQLSGRHEDLSASLLDRFLSKAAATERPPTELQKYAITESHTLSTDVIGQLTALFAASTNAIIVVDSTCNIQFMNDAASVAMSSDLGLSVSNSGALRIADRPQQFRLRTQVSLACLKNTTTAKVQPKEGSLYSSDFFRVLPLCQKYQEQQNKYAIICLKLQSQPLFDQELAQAMFSLSRAELAVCHALAAGDSVKDIAEARGTSKETVRYQLKSIYAKTRTNSQHGLVSLLLTTTAPPLFRSN